MTDVKVGDTVALFGTVTCVDKTDAALPYRVSYEDGSFVWARDVSMVPIPQPVSNAALDVANTLLAASHKAIDELRDDIYRANTLIGALEHLLAATQAEGRARGSLLNAKDTLDKAEKAYYSARDDFDRASSESDTNEGESS